MKRSVKLFFRSWYISSVIVFCLILGFWGTVKAYEQTRLIGFGEYRHAIEYQDGVLKFFDIEIDLIQREAPAGNSAEFSEKRFIFTTSHRLIQNSE